MSTETIALGLPPVPRERRSRADVEAAAPVTGEKKVLLATRAVTARALTVPVIAVEKALEHYGAPSASTQADCAQPPRGGRPWRSRALSSLMKWTKSPKVP